MYVRFVIFIEVDESLVETPAYFAATNLYDPCSSS